MKKAAFALLFVLIASWAAGPLLAAEKDRGELTIIRKAVADAPASEPAARPRWFKLVVTDDRIHKDVVKLSLPIGLCDFLLRQCRNVKVNLDRRLSDLDLDEIWSELKRSVPLTIIEVSGPKETIKIWLE